MGRFFYLLNVAIEAVFVNKMRSILTALGIVFGVAAVIAILAIGKGAEREIVEQMKLVGVNNIVITPIGNKMKSLDGSAEGKDLNGMYSPGLSFADVDAIKEIVPQVKSISPEVIYSYPVIANGRRINGQLSGVAPSYFDLFSLQLEEGGYFAEEHAKRALPVCVIGQGVKAKLFTNTSPVGQKIKCGDVWLEIVGVLKNKPMAMGDFNMNSVNDMVYAPLHTVLVRFKDRSAITKSALAGGNQVASDESSAAGSSFQSKGDTEINALDRIIVQVYESDFLVSVSNVLESMLLRRHNNVKDFSIVVPELLLKQEQRTKTIFNIVLGTIAGISLLVGGIGIMNIMLASVMERYKEIGIRLAIGARKNDVVFQFLSEAIIISITGGLFGVMLGVFLARMIMRFADIYTIVTMDGIVLSFVISVAVGIIFGWVPARKAARQDPVESLRLG